MMKNAFRKIHRWLGLLMALQIIAWMGSGLYFAIYPIETIRGEHLTVPVDALGTGTLEGIIAPAQAWSSLDSTLAGGGSLKSISIVEDRGRTWYRISGSHDGERFTRLVDARSGEARPFLEAGEVAQIAMEKLAVEGTIERIDMLTEHEPGSEFRGRALPLWRVDYSEPENLNLYIDGWTGEIVARRTTKWRIFDFLWMLHIMDFDERDDFSTPLLQIAAVLGLFVSMTGLVFWAMTTRLFRSGAMRRNRALL